jgi:uncharacterized membrane protein YhaH (DUF805 family)
VLSFSKNQEFMETLIIAAIILFLIFSSLALFTRRSSDIRLEGKNLVIRYPTSKKEINLEAELKSWKMQEIKHLWIGRTQTINLELQSGRRHHINSRSNRETIGSIFHFLNENFEEKRENYI